MIEHSRFFEGLIVALIVSGLIWYGLFYVLSDIGNGKFHAGPLKTERVMEAEKFNVERMEGL